jgi:hypothetical protein
MSERKNVFVYAPPGQWPPYVRVDAIAGDLVFSARGEAHLDIHQAQLLVTNLERWIVETAS